MSQVIGSRYIQFATLFFAFFYAITLPAVRAFSGIEMKIPKVASALLGFFTLLALIHCSKRLYDLWMALTKKLNVFGTALVFGICYFAVVPLFWMISCLMDPLQLRTSKNCQTFWTKRRNREINLESLQRMG
jgi:hypothetical protein